LHNAQEEEGAFSLVPAGPEGGAAAASQRGVSEWSAGSHRSSC